MSNSPCSQRAENFHPLDRVDFAVQVAHFQSDFAQVIGQILRGAFRKSSDQDAFAIFRPLPAEFDRLVNLVFKGTDS